jgi:pimeloyl-ACP methyl ester carboxylesterase
MLASLASPRATLECVKSFSETDFREDLKNVSVPTLIIHGDSDKTVPIEASSNRTAKALSGTSTLYMRELHMVYIIRIGIDSIRT